MEESNNLICQAIINSGIALEADAETEVETGPGPGVSRSARLALQSPGTESRVTDIQLSEECVEMEDETVLSSGVRETIIW